MSRSSTEPWLDHLAVQLFLRRGVACDLLGVIFIFDRSKLDVRSLVLGQPSFTFLRSREFFLSKTAACDEPMSGMKLLKARACC